MTERRTTHDSWYRLAPLRPRLRVGVEVTRQRFRGQLWFVIEDAASSQYFRVSDSAYRFIGLLDGQRTVEDALAECERTIGDRAPTRGEAVQVLGQLYSSNLLTADVPADAESLLRRGRRRTQREITGRLRSFLFVQLPLLDPDAFLDRWSWLAAPIFTRWGFGLWAVLLLAAIIAVGRRAGEFASASAQVLAPSNLGWLIGTFILIKLAHELGHGFACKVLGKRERTGGAAGECHELGVLLIVLLPIPYVDASSSWTLRSRWRRITVNAAGMYFELAIAAVAALVWSSTALGSQVNTLAHNAVLLAGVTTILFNANPLLRYDGYYILSDLFEAPNLYQRSREAIYYYVKKYIYKAREPKDPASSVRSRNWLATYGVASAIYRVVVLLVIIRFVADQLFALGLVLAIVAGVFLFSAPLVQLVKYLASSSELARTRRRAGLITGVGFGAIVAAVLLVPLPDRVRVDGIVDAARTTEVFAGTDGFIDWIETDGRLVGAGAPLLRQSNEETGAVLLQVGARLDAARTAQLANLDSPGDAAVFAQRARVLEQQYEQTEAELDRMTARAPFEGLWVTPVGDRALGAYVRRGERLGQLIDPSTLRIRAVVGQTAAGSLQREALDHPVDIRPMMRPKQQIAGTVRSIGASGRRDLPSAALGIAAGGSIETDPSGESGTTARDPVFEVVVEPRETQQLFVGQRVQVRFHRDPKPLLTQIVRAARQEFQKRFGAPQ
jgi:putative peptide zinc metalloprotease protein